MKTLLCLCFAVVLIFGCMFAFFSFHVLTRTDVERALRGLVKIVNTSSHAMHDRVTNASTSGAVSQLLSSITAPRLPASPLVAPTVVPAVAPTIVPAMAPTIVPAVAPTIVPAVASAVSAPALKVPVFIPHIAGFSAARDANVKKMLSTFSNAQIVVGVRGLDDECLQLLYDNNIRIANTFYRRDTVDVGKIGVTCAWIRVLLACKLSGSQRCVWIEDDIKLSVEEVATVERVALSKVFSTPLCQIGVDVSNSGMGDTIDIIRADKIDTIFTMLRKGIDDPSDLMFNKNKFYTRGEQIGGLINKNDPKTSVIRTQKSMPIVEYNAKISAMGTALQSASKTSRSKILTDMVVFIFSAREHRERRDAIRDSWSSGCESCFFVIGDTHCHVPLPARKAYECAASREHTVKEKEAHDAVVQNIDNELKVESDTFHDILFVEMVDAYRNLAEKLQLSYKWGVSSTNAKWFVKVDDDTFVRPHKLQTHLNSFQSGHVIIAQKFWMKSDVRRDGKWAEQKFKEKYYPPFPFGAGHAVSRDIAEYVASNVLVFYGGEDTSLGIWISEAPFKTTLNLSKKFEGINGKCTDNKKVVIGHDIAPAKMRMCGKLEKDQQPKTNDLNDKVYAGMATIKGREKNLKRALQSLSGQISKIFVTCTPGCESLQTDKFFSQKWITLTSMPSKSSQQDCEKFAGISSIVEESAYFFTVDDDIVYPKDYVSTLLHALKKYNRKVVVTHHGGILPNKVTNYRKERNKFHFNSLISKDTLINIAGTGVTAFHTDTVKNDFQCYPRHADLAFAKYCQEKKIPIFAVKQKQNRFVTLTNPFTLWSSYNAREEKDTTDYAQRVKWSLIPYDKTQVEKGNPIETTVTKMTDARGKTFLVSPELDVANTIEIQKRILYMFKQFDEVCQRNNILYWAIGGTELGAHRHGGFIPWDADLDVCMHEDDYKRLRSVKDEFTEDIWLEDAKSDKYYLRKDWAKLRYLHSDYASYSATNKDCHNGIQIDIFIDLNNRNNRCRMYDKVRVQPVSRVKFEDAVINVVSDTVSALHVFFGADLKSPPVGKRNQHQGTAIFYAPDWVKKKYPTLYPARDCYDDGKIKPECVQKSVETLPCCSATSKRCNWNKVPPYTIPKCEEKNLLQLLEWTKSVLTVPWFITAGTLLGSIRDGGHIPHETDIDIQIAERDFASAIAQIREHIKGTHYTFEDGTPARVFFSATNTIHVDIWKFKIFETEIEDGIGIKGKGRKKYRLPKDYYFPASTCTYNEVEYPCPNKSREWLRHRYGPEYMVPKAKYSPNPAYNDGDDFGVVDTYTDILQCPNGLDRSRAPPHKNWNLFVDVVTIFNSLDAPYTLHGGTLLNYARDCNVLDLDLDFTVTGTWMLTHHDAFLKTMKDNGFSIFRKFGNIGDFGYELAFKKGKSINVDVFTVQEEEDNFVSATWVRGFPYRCYTKRTSYEKREWGGVTVRVPVPVDKALISHYGIHYDKPYPGTYQWDKTIFEFGWCKKKTQRLLRH